MKGNRTSGKERSQLVRLSWTEIVMSYYEAVEHLEMCVAELCDQDDAEEKAAFEIVEARIRRVGGRICF